MDMDRTPESRALGATFAESRYFEVVATPEEEQFVQELMDRSRVQAVIRVMPGFAKDIARGERTGVQILVEGTNSNTASLVSNYANLVIAGYAAQVSAAQQGRKIMARSPSGPVNGSLPSVTSRSRVWFNPELRSRNYFVPGTVVNILMSVTLMLTALGLVREKEIGTMEQLMVTPIRPVELMIGKMIPFALVGLIDLALVTTGALVVFGVPPAGQPAAAAGQRAVVPDELARRGAVHLDDFPDAAAGHDFVVLLLDARLHVERVHVSDSQHARVDPDAVLPESGALLHGDRARNFSERLRSRGAVAADGGAGGLRSRDSGSQRLALPETAGLDYRFSKSTISAVNFSTNDLPRLIRLSSVM
jgi:hypothetical protein